MIIAVTRPHGLDLRDRDNFREFKVLVEGVPADLLEAALSPVARIEGDYAWVSQAALRRWSGVEQPAAWLAAFDAMIESVRRFGWVNDADGTVRAHIEREGAGH